jgi:hypothetical protein
MVALALLGHAVTGLAAEPRLTMVVHPGYLPGIPVLIRVEALNAQGKTDRERWDAEAVLATDQPGVTLSTHRVSLCNGRGTAWVTVSGTTNFTLTATLDALGASRTMTFLGDTPATTVSGNLTGTSVTWSNVVRVVGNVTNPPGQTLTVLPGTYVLLSGVPSGNNGTALEIQGTLHSLGTEDQPVTFTAATPSHPWGDLRHRNAQPSRYQHTIITRGGHSPPSGHVPTAGIVLRVINSSVLLTDSAIADTPGKALRASGSDLRLTNCLVSRAAHGGEIDSSALVAEDCWFTEMRGPDDNDGLYLWGQELGQALLLRGCVFGLVDDDAADNLDALVTYEDCIFRDAYDKGISQIAGTMTVRHCLVANCAIGISIKGAGSTVTGQIHVDRTTISARDRGLEVRNKSGIPVVFLDYYVTNSIISAATDIHTDYSPTNIHLHYTDTPHSVWPGSGNLSSAPLFVNGVNDFRLQSGSPCIDTGAPGLSDPDGSPMDIGYHTFLAPSPHLDAPGFSPEAGFHFSLHGRTQRNYVIEAADQNLHWTPVKTVWQSTDPTSVSDPEATTRPHRIYRARLAP